MLAPHYGSVGFLSSRRGFRAADTAVDLGTANTVTYVRGEGVVLFEPSVIAVDDETGAVQAVGEEAKRMIGRTPASIRATRPLRNGVITDFEVTEQMLRHFIRKTIGSRFRSPRVIVCVPSGITEVERRAVVEATVSAGAADAALIEEPMAAAIGARLPIAEPAGNLVVDVGGGTTEIAVISLGAMVVWESLRLGGYEMDEAIVRHVKREHGLVIGQEGAEAVKVAIGSAWDGDDGRAEVRGRDTGTGLLRRAVLGADEVREALDPPVAAIVEAVKDTLERTPPELSADIVARGIVLAGGGCLLRGLPERLAAETDLPVQLVDEPLTCVAVGAGKSLDDFDAIAKAAGAKNYVERGLFS